jgi:hypothetical protein
VKHVSASCIFLLMLSDLFFLNSNVSFLISIFIFETWSHYVAQAGLDSGSFCLDLLSTGVISVCHHACAQLCFLNCSY